MIFPPPQARHGITPNWAHDDRARQAFQRTLREGVIRTLSGGSRVVFEQRVRPRFQREHRRDFTDRILYLFREEAEDLGRNDTPAAYEAAVKISADG